MQTPKIPDLSTVDGIKPITMLFILAMAALFVIALVVWLALRGST